MAWRMKIERVDEKTVKCFLSNEELEEYDISYKDFVTRSDRAREIVEEIMAQAVEEVDYKPPQFAFDLQIMILPEQGMILTFTERTPDDLKNSTNLMNYLREMRRILKEKLGLDGSTIAGLLAQAMMTAAAGQGAAEPNAAGQGAAGQEPQDNTETVAKKEAIQAPFCYFPFCQYAQSLFLRERTAQEPAGDQQALPGRRYILSASGARRRFL